MRWSLLAAVSVSPLMMFSFAGFGSAQTPQENRISGPIVHENLAVYFIHGKSAPGKVPLTLEEAMAKGVVKVRETSNVNQLEIENLGVDEVFVQSGDIVKGGKQDRTLMVSLVLPPKSGSVPIASFCVEEGRWSARGREDVKNFSTASAAVPSREMKLAMKAPIAAARLRSPPTRPPMPMTVVGRSCPTIPPRARPACGSSRCGRACARPRPSSPAISVRRSARRNRRSSLQLALENEKLMDAQKVYIKALKAAGESGDDIVGFVFAVNGQLNSADVYPSNGLFRKMWAKLLTASVIEAIGHKDEPAVAPPAVERWRPSWRRQKPASRAKSRSTPASSSKLAKPTRPICSRLRARRRRAHRRAGCTGIIWRSNAVMAGGRNSRYGRQLILWTGAPERQLMASPEMTKPCFS